MRTWWIERDFIEIHSPKLMASGIRVQRRAVRAGVLRRADRLPRAEPAVLQADGAVGRLRQDLRDRRRLPRRPVVHLAPRDRVHDRSTPRSAGSTRTRTSRACRRSSSRIAIGAVTDKHGAEIEELFGVEVTVPTVPFPRIPLAEAREIVAARGYEIPRTDGDLDPEGERQISAHVEGDATGTTSSSSPTTPTRSARSTTCAMTRPGSPRATTSSTTASRSRPARSASTASTCSIEQAKREGPRARAPRLLLRLLPLRRAAARRLRHGPRARADAAARRIVDPRGHVPLPRPDAPRPVASRDRGDGILIEGSFNFRDTGGMP